MKCVRSRENENETVKRIMHARARSCAIAKIPNSVARTALQTIIFLCSLAVANAASSR